MDDMIFSFKVETPPAWIPIGRTAENDWRTIEIDCSYWFNMDASGNVVLMYRPNCGMAPYPLLIERDGDNIVWHPKSGELVEGVGQMQAFFYVGESKIGSSEMVSCEVDGSLLSGDTGTDPGAVAPPWAIDIIEQIAVLSGHYPKIIDGDLFVWDSEIEDWVQFEGGSSDAVLYTEQALTDAQKAQARENIGAGTYSKPSGGIPDSDIASAATWNAKYTKPASGIPASDLAAGVIPTVPQMATAADMSDWTSGKTVDAAVLKEDFTAAALELNDLSVNKADRTDIPTAVSELTNDSGFVTAQQAAAAAPVQSVNGMTGAVTIPTGSSDAVLYTPQTLTDAQKEQARENVEAASMSDIPSLAAYRTASAQDAIDAAQDSAIAAKYTKPSGGIPDSDIASAAVWNTKGTYSKPSGGIPKTDLASDVRTSLGKADSALQEHQSLDAYRTASAQDAIDAAQNAAIAAKYTKPASGIPASDLASGVIPTVPQMAVYTNMQDWTEGKVVDALTLRTVVAGAAQQVAAKADASSVYTKTEIDNKGYQTATQVQTAIAAKYTKPNGGIPKSDLDAAVRASLDKADTALQEHQSLAAYRKASEQDAIDATKLNTTGNAYRSASIPMGHLDSTSTATVMTATVDGITELRDGVCMWLRNGVITSASGFTLNVNGLGAKPCYSSLAAASRSTTIFNVNYTMLMVYNEDRVEGGCWDIVYGVDTNTTYTPVKLGFGYGTCTTAAATAAKTASISSYALTTGGIVSIHFSNDVPANATLNISSKGSKAIYYRGAAITAGVIKAGDTATFIYSTYYHLIAIDRDESGDVLPSVTASDNGKFLRVVNGAWAAAMIPAAESNSF